MELLIGIGFLGAFIWLLANNVGSNDKSGSKRDVSPASRSRGHDRNVFDSKSAKPLDRERTLKGPARIVDGDTIVIAKTQIRLFGIDAPELEHPYGQKAKWALVEMCKGQLVCAEITEQDQFGRAVAKCFLPDGRDLSAEMVKIGLAIDWAKYSGGIYRSFETPASRKHLWLAVARQQGRMHVWDEFEARKKPKRSNDLSK